MPSQVGAKKRVQYTPERMAMAIHMVQSGAMSKKAAAKSCGVPRTTLLDKLAGRVPEKPTPPGRHTVLTEAEENTLVRYCHLMADIGYPLTKKTLLGEVKRVLDIDGRPTPFKDNLPGKKWFKAFQKRHPDITMRTAMSLGHERSIVNMDMIQSWFDGVSNYLKKEVPEYETLLASPRRVFNADESGFPLAPKPGRVIAEKGARHLYQVVTNTKTQITVMVAFNAYDDYAPPMILFPGERLRDVGLSGFPEATYATTKNGWMDSETFVEFLKSLHAFAERQSIQFPILLFVDGHSTHVSLESAEFCKENRIILYCLLPNATHILQACDIVFFSPMKAAWQAQVKTWQADNIGRVITKKEFPLVFRSAWEKVANYENAANGFKRSGLFPFTANGIDTTKLGPSKIANADKIVPPSAGDAAQISTSYTRSSASVDNESQDSPNLSVNASGDHTYSTVSVPAPSMCAVVTRDVFSDTAAAMVDSLPGDIDTSVMLAFDADSMMTAEQPLDSVTEGSQLLTRSTESDIVLPPAVEFVTVQSPQPVAQGPAKTVAQGPCTNVATLPKKQSDPAHVAPAFLKLKVPEPKEKKKVDRLRDKLTKALSGSDAIRMLQERKEKKAAEELAKAKRKEEREQKRMQKEAEKERKRVERERKQIQRKTKNAEQKSKPKSKKRKLMKVSSESESEAVPYMDEDSDNFEEEFDMCPGCSRGDQHPSRWVRCDDCSTRRHFICADRPDFELLDESERKKVEFVCPLCQ